jgi:hypothetical protein
MRQTLESTNVEITIEGANKQILALEGQPGGRRKRKNVWLARIDGFFELVASNQIMEFLSELDNRSTLERMLLKKNGFRVAEGRRSKASACKKARKLAKQAKNQQGKRSRRMIIALTRRGAA